MNARHFNYAKIKIIAVLFFFCNTILFEEITVEDGDYMQVTKLQSLLEYAFVWFLALKGEKLFDEKLYACKRGYFFHSQNKRFDGKLAG
jgi:uncharacterized phage-associated protein